MSQIILGNEILHGVLNLKIKPFETKHILLHGISGSGKSNLLELMIDQLHDLTFEELIKYFPELASKVNMVIFDTESEFGRVRKHNKDFIILGNEGEMPIDLKQAREIGKQIRIQKLNVIIQLASLESEDEREEFVANVIRGMLDVPTEYWNNITAVVIDEIQLYCSGSKKTKSRDAVVTLTQTGRKRGLLGIFATQGIKDFYKNARDQCANRIIGYTDDPDNRELACELLGMPKSESDKFLELGKEPKGRFYARGTEIGTGESQIPIMFRSKLIQWTHSEKYAIPKPTEYVLQKAEDLRKSLVGAVNVSNETMLRQELQRANNENTMLKQNQMDEQTKQRIINEATQSAYLKGVQKAMDEARLEIKMLNEIYEKSRFPFRKVKTVIVKERFSPYGDSISVEEKDE